MPKQTQSSNIGAFQVEKQAEVGVAGASAVGQMGANGAGGVDLGGGGAGFNPAAMMAGMAVGGAIGQNIARTMNNMTPGATAQPSIGAVPPPIPTVAYHVAVNGQATGPFDIAALTQMAIAGTFTRDSLVWKQGMSGWEKASAVQDLMSVFANAMPPIPPINA